MQIRPFAIERFYERWEFRAELMLSSSDCESRTIEELLALEPDAHGRPLEQWCGANMPEALGLLEANLAEAE